MKTYKITLIITVESEEDINYIASSICRGRMEWGSKEEGIRSIEIEECTKDE